MISRRNFLGAVGGATLGWPRQLDALSRLVVDGPRADDEAFWNVVRSGFLLPLDRLYFNNGTLGVPPAVVVDAVAEHERRVAMSFPPRLKWDDLKDTLGRILDGDPEGFVFPRNTTEAMSFVAWGIDVEPGGEVVTTDHEHIGGRKPWEALCARRGLTLVEAALPATAASSEELLDAVWSRVGPSTRVVVVSHVTFTNGTVFPVEELVRRCREAGIISVIDGAHPPGMMEVSLRGVDPDFYVSSPHKWLLAPRGTGLLYMRESWRGTLWPGVVSGGWDDLALGAHRFNHMGTMDESRLAGFLVAAEYHDTLGNGRVSDRVAYLGQRLEQGLRQIPGITLRSPTTESGLRAGMISFTLDGIPSVELQRHLSQAANLRTRVIGEYDLGWMRLSTHIYNGPDQVDRVLELLDQVSKNGIS